MDEKIVRAKISFGVALLCAAANGFLTHQGVISERIGAAIGSLIIPIAGFLIVRFVLKRELMSYWTGAGLVFINLAFIFLRESGF